MTAEADYKKPPLGIKPEWLHDAERIVEICDAIKRYIEAQKCIPWPWTSELNDLLTKYRKTPIRSDWRAEQ